MNFNHVDKNYSKVTMIWCRIVNLEMRLKEIVSKCKEQTTEAYAMSRTEKHKQVGAHDTGKRSQKDLDTPVNAWAFSEATTGIGKTTL